MRVVDIDPVDVDDRGSVPVGDEVGPESREVVVNVVRSVEPSVVMAEVIICVVIAGNCPEDELMPPPRVPVGVGEAMDEDKLAATLLNDATDAVETLEIDHQYSECRLKTSRGSEVSVLIPNSSIVVKWAEQNKL